MIYKLIIFNNCNKILNFSNTFEITILNLPIFKVNPFAYKRLLIKETEHFVLKIRQIYLNVFVKII